jgi:hypothetical protein
MIIYAIGDSHKIYKTAVKSNTLAIYYFFIAQIPQNLISEINICL